MLAKILNYLKTVTAIYSDGSVEKNSDQGNPQMISLQIAGEKSSW